VLRHVADCLDPAARPRASPNTFRARDVHRAVAAPTPWEKAAPEWVSFGPERPSGTSDSIRRRGDDEDRFEVGTESGGKNARTGVESAGAAGQKRAVGRHPLFPVAQVLMTDRVSERRRAAQLARHYRDHEGLTIAEIGHRLGRAEGTVKAYLYDPIGEKAREVKARYGGACRGCGAPTSPRGGKGDAYESASAAVPGRSRGNGPASGAVTRCAPGERATALRRPPTTGRAPTHAGAAPKRSNDYNPENGPRRPPSSICTGAGRRPSPTPSSAAPERLGVNAVDTRARACAWPSVNGSAEGRRERRCHSSRAGEPT
jgi:hypothetical protein